MLHLLLLLPWAQTQAPAHDAYTHVVAISIDGLRSDALTTEFGQELPGFQRLRQGAYTLNARTDADYSVTLPNHASMLTGRLVLGEEGHQWTGNATPLPIAKMNLKSGEIPQGVFDVTSQHKVADSLIASKSKFRLFPQTWDTIDEFQTLKKAPEAMDAALQALASAAGQHVPSFTFLHLRELDDAGHDQGWVMDPGSAYMKALKQVDAELMRLFDWLDAHPGFALHTAILLTSDHGGGIPLKNHHGQGRQWVNIIIPFFVWTGDGLAKGDLYELNQGQRKDPGIQLHAPKHCEHAPIRNGEIANLSLQLLGLHAIPGSQLNAAQDLRWHPMP